MMRSVVSSLALACFLACSAALGGDYGTINLAPTSPARPGGDMGNGGRFDWEITQNASTPLYKLYDSPAASDPDSLAEELYTFCVELGPGISSSQFQVDKLTTHIDGAKASRLQKLGAHYWDIGIGSTVLGGSYDLDEQAGAFQLAAWEIVLGANGNNLAFVPNGQTGFFNADAIALANSWLASLDTLSGSTLVELVWLSSDTIQDQITLICVPEAGSIAVWSTILCGGIGLIVYRRGQKLA